MNELSHKVIVIGGGAAGMMAAGTAAQHGAAVVLLERNNAPGKKLLITGKGRCNVTNSCPPEEVLKNVLSNSRFLYSAVYGFSPEDVMAFFEGQGCALKVERGNRVFPESDRSSSVLDALKKYLREDRVVTRTERAEEILVEDGRVIGVKTEAGICYGSSVILCTGGCSYPLTGSTGDGYAMAEALGHTVEPVRGALVPLVSDDGFCKEMQGLSLRNVGVKLYNSKKKVIYEDFGELLFTHFGVSGPTILSASCAIRKDEPCTLSLDLKPALDEQKLDARILRDFQKYQNRKLENALQDLYPSSMIPVIIARSGIDPETRICDVTKQQRRAILELTKNFTISVTGKRPVEEAIVTAGGIRVKDVNPKTMESKLVHGLYFAGEVLDVDAYTGGFNLQIAWSTGRAAGIAAANQEE